MHSIGIDLLLRCVALMDTQSILTELRAERDRLNNAIAALEGSTGKRGRRSSASNAFPTRRRRRMSAAARTRISKAMKARWASGKMKGNRKKAA
jgi:hypothetical protein